MIETAGVDRDHIPTVKRIEAAPWASGMWDAGRRVKQRTEHLVESVIRPKGERQYRQDESSEQERFFHMDCFLGGIFLHQRHVPGQNNFSSLNV
jgi:hypothetical protein